MSKRDETPVYIGLLPCGCLGTAVVSTCVDAPEHLRQMAKDKLTIQTVPCWHLHERVVTLHCDEHERA